MSTNFPTAPACAACGHDATEHQQHVIPGGLCQRCGYFHAACYAYRAQPHAPTCPSWCELAPEQHAPDVAKQATTNGCPDWCASPDEPFEPLCREPGVFARSHERQLAELDNGAVLVLIEAEDRLTLTGAGATFTPGVPLVGVYAALQGARLTAGQARQLAGALVDAAATLDQVTR